jgi:hypothetical protein
MNNSASIIVGRRHDIRRRPETPHLTHPELYDGMRREDATKTGY